MGKRYIEVHETNEQAFRKGFGELFRVVNPKPQLGVSLGQFMGSGFNDSMV